MEGAAGHGEAVLWGACRRRAVCGETTARAQHRPGAAAWVLRVWRAGSEWPPAASHISRHSHHRYASIKTPGIRNTHSLTPAHVCQ